MFASIPEILKAFKEGQMVIILDDEDRENEGDLIVAAEKVTPEQMAFIVRHTSGIVCAPLTKARALALDLAPMVQVNDAPLSTAFTISVDAKEGLTTGISAIERVNTVRALAKQDAKHSDFVRPGHIFPLVAVEGGVLVRSGHTEAAVDLCRLSGLNEVGVIAELVNDDGSIKRGEALHAFAKEHNLLMTTVASLIAYREKNEKLIEKISEETLVLQGKEFHTYQYKTPFDPAEHSVLAYGDLTKAPLVRFQRANPLQDVFGDRSLIESIISKLIAHGNGILIYASPATGVGRGNARHANTTSWREIGLGAQILKDLNINKIYILSSKPRKYIGLEGYGISVAGEILIENT